MPLNKETKPKPFFSLPPFLVLSALKVAKRIFVAVLFLFFLGLLSSLHDWNYLKFIQSIFIAELVIFIHKVCSVLVIEHLKYTRSQWCLVTVIFTLTQSSDSDYTMAWGARGVMVIIVGNGHGNMSSNPGQG